MPEATASTAEAQLGRILLILAAAQAEEGVSVAELAKRLGVTPATIRQDVAEVTSRDFYHPGAWVMEMTILLERERISVPVPGHFKRPMRLTPHEAAALGLALRARAAEADVGSREELLELAKALERALMAPVPRTVEAGKSKGTGRGVAAGAGVAGAGASGLGLAGGAGGLGGRGSRTASRSRAGPGKAVRATLASWAEIDPGDSARAGVRLLLEGAIVAHTPVCIRYLKPGDGAPEDRLIHPYALLSAEGEWYVLAYSVERAGMREFRLDRVLEARLAEGSFEVPTDFSLEDYTRAGKPYHAPDTELDVQVRYSPQIARWILERYAGEAQPCNDGSVVVRHRVADPRWLVREVLRFAGAAVVEAPAEMREYVARAAEALANAM